MLDLRAGVELVHVPFTGAGPAAEAALAGTTDLAGVNISAAMPLIKDGKLRALVQTGATALVRIARYADDGAGWHPPTPNPRRCRFCSGRKHAGRVIERLSNAVVKVLAAPELRDQLLKTGFAVSGKGPAELKQLTGREVAKWRDVIAEAKLTVN